MKNDQLESINFKNCKAKIIQQPCIKMSRIEKDATNSHKTCMEELELDIHIRNILEKSELLTLENVQKFVSQKVTFEDLKDSNGQVNVSHGDLESIGFTEFRPRKKILKELKEYVPEGNFHITIYTLVLV